LQAARIVGFAERDQRDAELGASLDLTLGLFPWADLRRAPRRLDPSRSLRLLCRAITTGGYPNKPEWKTVILCCRSQSC